MLDGTGGNTVSSTGNVDVDNNGLLVLQGAIDNTGTIALDSSGNITTLQLDVSGAKLSGGGVVTMSDSPGNNYIQGNGQNGGGAGTDVLINVNNTIEGVGTIGGNGMGLVNKGGGTIDANISGTTLIVNNQGNNSPNSSEAGTVGNAGTLEATDSATLLIQQTAIDNIGGVISAAGGDVNLQSAFITGGTLETSSGGVINIVNNGSVFDGTGGNTVSNAGSVDVDDNGLLVLQGAIDNTGTIALDSSGHGTTLQFDISGATLSGGGVVTLSDSPGNNYIQGNGQNGGGAGTDVLTNVNNTIEGVGTIGGNGLGLVNDGTIDANVSGATLSINTGTTVSNGGLLEATAGGILVVHDSVSGTGNIEVGSNATVELGGTSTNAVTFEGVNGILQIDSSGTSTPFSVVGNGAAISASDVIYVPHISFDAAADSYNPNTDVLTVGDGQGHSITIDVVGGVGGGNFTFQPDASGTEIFDPSAASPLTIATGALLELASPVASGESVTFQGSTGSLTLDNPSSFHGTIAGFTGDGTLAGSDQIDLKGIDYQSSSFADSFNAATDTLSVSEGADSATLHFTGIYQAANFSFTSDGTGGTIVYDPPVPAGPAPGNSAVAAQTSHGFVFNFANAGHDASIDLHWATDVQHPTAANLSTAWAETHDVGPGTAPEGFDPTSQAAIIKAQLHSHDFHFA